MQLLRGAGQRGCFAQSPVEEPKAVKYVKIAVRNFLWIDVSAATVPIAAPGIANHHHLAHSAGIVRKNAEVAEFLRRSPVPSQFHRVVPIRSGSAKAEIARCKSVFPRKSKHTNIAWA